MGASGMAGDYAAFNEMQPTQNPDRILLIKALLGRRKAPLVAGRARMTSAHKGAEHFCQSLEHAGASFVRQQGVAGKAATLDPSPTPALTPRPAWIPF